MCNLRIMRIRMVQSPLGMQERLGALFELSAFGSVGVVTAAVLIMAVWVLLPSAERNLARTPLVLLVLHLGLLLVQTFLPHRVVAQRYLGYAALFLLLASIGRAGFLVAVHSVVSRGLTRPLPRIFRDLLQGLVYVIVVLITLRAAGVAPGSLLTTSALLTAVIGLSLQDTLGNLFAGLAIQAQRPFDVGDWIQFDENAKHVGRVVEINWRATRLLTLDQVEVTVPNGVLAKAPISNYTKPSPVSRRVVYVTAPYDVSPLRIEEIVLSAVREIPGILREPRPSVILHDFGDKGIEYRVRYFTSDFQSRERIDGVVRERLWYAFHRAEIRIPLPTRTVYSHEVTPKTAKELEAAEVERRQKALSYVDFLQKLPGSALHKLASLGETRLYAEGEIILKQGEEGNELFIVWHGEVAVMLDRTDRHDSVEITRLGPGKFFGEMSVMTGEHRSATVKATKPCEMIVIGKKAFQEVLAETPSLAQQISEVLANRLEELGERAALADKRTAMSRQEQSSLLLSRIKQFFSI
jgi:small-conductance mechanosensitive channel/CRP-like cAMP-binding protein